MKLNKYNIPGCSQYEIVDGLKCNPELVIDNIFCTDPESFNNTIDALYLDFKKLDNWNNIDTSISVEEFNHRAQQQWKMPDSYKIIDIKSILLEKCQNQLQIDRVNYELSLYDKFNLIPLLQYLKYLIDVIKQNNIILGVGRGSSCASYCLYLLGIHKVDSIKYGLDINEFLRDRGELWQE